MTALLHIRDAGYHDDTVMFSVMAETACAHAAACRGAGDVCIDHRTLWGLLRFRLQARLQDQGLWRLHPGPWRHD